MGVVTPSVLVPVTAEAYARRRRRVVAALVVLAALIAIAARIAYRHTTSPVEAQESFDIGRQKLQIGRYNEAVFSFDRAIQLRRDFSEAYLLRGKALAANADGQGEFDRAIGDFTTVVRLRPRDPDPLIERCSVYLSLARMTDVISDCTAALAIDPARERAYTLRGTAFRKSGSFREALADFTRAVELAPTPDNYFQRSAVYQLLGDPGKAILDLDKMLNVMPESPPALLARARARFETGDTEGAESDRRRAFELWPNADPRIFRGSLGIAP